MITLNDYLYSGDTVLKILQKYTEDLRKEAKKNDNEVDLVHSTVSAPDHGTSGA